MVFIYRGAVGRGRGWTASTHFFVWNDPLRTFYVHVRLCPCESLASTRFSWRLHTVHSIYEMIRYVRLYTFVNVRESGVHPLLIAFTHFFLWLHFWF